MHEPWDWATVAAHFELWTDIYCSVDSVLYVGCVKGTGGRGAVASLCVFARDHTETADMCVHVYCVNVCGLMRRRLHALWKNVAGSTVLCHVRKSQE